VLPGDRVIFNILDDKQAVIEKIIPRKNEFIRPSVVNVDQLLIVAAVKKPNPDFFLIDKLTLLAKNNKLKPVIIFNKIDFVNNLPDYIEEYKKIGFEIICTSVKENIGINNLKSKLESKLSVLAGVSGVGKSSLLNTISKNICLKTGEISQKLKRGKHTTKHVELIVLDNGGLVADTPGFSKIDIPNNIKKEDLSLFFPEISSLRNYCKFSSCLHNKEPQCAVKEAVENKTIPEWRYRNYLRLLEEIIKKERSY
jgi:ribosome biogenesis GTPase